MYIYHRLPDYTTSCIAILSLIQHIAVTLMGRSKTVVEFFPIAAFCRVLPNKSQQEHVFYPLPWQIKSTLIISKILPVRARFAAFYRTLRSRFSGTYYPKLLAEMANRGKMRQIEDVKSSKIVVEIGVFYYRLPWVTLADLECIWVRGWSTNWNCHPVLPITLRILLIHRNCHFAGIVFCQGVTCSS